MRPLFARSSSVESLCCGVRKPKRFSARVIERALLGRRIRASHDVVPRASQNIEIECDLGLLHITGKLEEQERKLFTQVAVNI